jgi:hypothetical protein
MGFMGRAITDVPKLKEILIALHLTISWVILFASCAPSPQQAAHVCIAALVLKTCSIRAYLLDVAMPQ